MMQASTGLPIELPLARPRPERGDAAANRGRILAAMRRLVSEQGAGGISMDEVAAAAGVGKGTLFRRFGDRAGLIEALVDDYMRGFQDDFLAGPPPLGPGAPAAERLEAFLLALVALQHEHLPLALAAENGGLRPPPGAWAPLFLHARALLAEMRPDLDADVIATMLLGAIAPPVLSRLPHDSDGERASIAASVQALLRGLTTVAG